MLYAHCRATHVRPYRILSEGDALVPLRTIDPAGREEFKSARQGIHGHVATHGKTYVVDDPTQGELVRKLARVSDDVPVWCFVIRQGPRKIGLVAVQGWSGSQPDRELLNSMELLINQFWSTLTEVCRSRTADRMDSPTNTLTRESFLEEAQEVAKESYAAGEPIALVVFADNGRWDLATDVIRETSKTLRNRLRPDDVLGRFDDSRFVLLLRRVDSALGSLIAGQLVSRLSASPLTVALQEYNGGIRCGIVGSGGASPSVTELVTRSVRLCHDARLNDLCVASDVVHEVSEVRSGDRQPEGAAS
jgi:GGDEF domain-containing protein